MTEVSERPLVEAARLDARAFGPLYERYAVAIQEYALRCLHDHMEAEDVVAETFRRALEHLQRYEWRGVPFSAWLYRIAHNIIVSQYRRPALLPLEAAAEAVDAGLGPEQNLIRCERQHEVWSALAGLTPAQRRVLWLRYGRDQRAHEIARALGLSEGAVKQALRRARISARRRLATLHAEPAWQEGRPVVVATTSRLHGGPGRPAGRGEEAV
jgi:RNA polymerase sigma-70 factor (ECF subfamily)